MAQTKVFLVFPVLVRDKVAPLTTLRFFVYFNVVLI